MDKEGYQELRFLDEEKRENSCEMQLLGEESQRAVEKALAELPFVLGVYDCLPKNPDYDLIVRLDNSFLEEVFVEVKSSRRGCDRFRRKMGNRNRVSADERENLIKRKKIIVLIGRKAKYYIQDGFIKHLTGINNYYRDSANFQKGVK